MKKAIALVLAVSVGLILVYNFKTHQDRKKEARENAIIEKAVKQTLEKHKDKIKNGE